MTHDRIHPVEGAVNLRDFGGYRAQSGHAVKRGLLFRSGTLAYLSDEGRRDFEALGIQLICDLRRDDERADEPSALPPDQPARLEIPIDPGSAVEMRERLRNQELGFEARTQFMTALTGELTRDHTDDYATLFEGLLGLDDGGFLVHCSAGKDRTGVACALILSLLGVDRETVFKDYLFTNEAIDYEGFVLPRLVQRYEPDTIPDRDLVMTIAGVRSEYLEAAFHSIEESFDDMVHYLEAALHLSAADRARLQGRYLTPA